MVAPGPALAHKLLEQVMQQDSPPRPASEWLVDIAVYAKWFGAKAEAEEAAERWRDRFLVRLRRDREELIRLGRHCFYAFNSSSEYMIQGSAFIEDGIDSDDVKTLKRRRLRFAEYQDYIKGLSPTGFEHLCRGMLEVLGVHDPKLTPYSGDEGIDFYGRLDVGRFLPTVRLYPGVEARLRAWMIGQAKHYQATQVATPDVRDLVGAVALARGRAFGASGSRFEDLDIAVCDPVFYLFFTTGSISQNAWRLLEKSGVVAMDGQMVAAFLTDNDVGLDATGAFNAEVMEAWIQVQGGVRLIPLVEQDAPEEA